MVVPVTRAGSVGFPMVTSFGGFLCSESVSFSGLCLPPLLSALCQSQQIKRESREEAGLPGLTRQNKEDSEMSRKDETFNPQAEVERIRTRRTEARRKLYRKSRLDKYRAELVAMREAGASCADLAEWLRLNHRYKVHRSSIDRYLRRLSELSGEQQPTLQDEER